MNSPRIAYHPKQDVMPQSETAALASVYKFVFDCHAKKKAASTGDPDDGEESKNASTAEPEYKR